MNKMIDLYISFLLIITSTLAIIAIIMVITINSYRLTKHIRKKSEQEYKKIHGIVKDPIFNITLYDNFSYWIWIFKAVKNDDKIVNKYKKFLRKALYGILICIMTIIFISVYIYLKYKND